MVRVLAAHAENAAKSDTDANNAAADADATCAKFLASGSRWLQRRAVTVGGEPCLSLPTRSKECRFTLCRYIYCDDIVPIYIVLVYVLCCYILCRYVYIVPIYIYCADIYIYILFRYIEIEIV